MFHKLEYSKPKWINSDNIYMELTHLSLKPSNYDVDKKTDNWKVKVISQDTFLVKKHNLKFKNIISYTLNNVFNSIEILLNEKSNKKIMIKFKKN